MDPLARRRLGRTQVEVTQLGFGGAGLGDLFEVIPETQAAATLQAVNLEAVCSFSQDATARRMAAWSAWVMSRPITVTKGTRNRLSSQIPWSKRARSKGGLA